MNDIASLSSKDIIAAGWFVIIQIVWIVVRAKTKCKLLPITSVYDI